MKPPLFQWDGTVLRKLPHKVTGRLAKTNLAAATHTAQAPMGHHVTRAVFQYRLARRHMLGFIPTGPGATTSRI